MNRALKILHIRRRNKILRLLRTPIADRPTPYRATVMSIILQDPVFVVIVGVDSLANIADWDRKDTFPGWALRGGVGPLFGDGRLRALVGGLVVVVVARDDIGIEGGVDDVLDGDGSVVPLSKLVRSGRW